jgi:hypothetical protein
MASILTFRRRDRPDSTAARNPAPAKIIIFPGVRYERRSGPDAAAVWPVARLMTPVQPLPSK